MRIILPALLAFALTGGAANAFYAESNFGQMYAVCLQAQQNGPYRVTVASARQFCTTTALTCARYGYADFHVCLQSVYGAIQTPKQRKCSARADARGLHGHGRWMFRAGCES